MKPEFLKKQEKDAEHDERLTALENANVYSTQEQVIGKWIDENGNKVNCYRKAIIVTTTEAGYKEIAYDFSNIKEIIEMVAKVEQANGYEISCNFYNNASNFGLFYLHKANNKIYINNSSHTGKYIATIKYTKTTD